MDTPTSSSFILSQYAAYLAISLAVTLGVGRTLFKNGAAFLVDTFIGKERLADAVNQLLLVGFYLINCGWVVLSLKSSDPAFSAQQVMENLASKIGSVLLVLGLMHFLNLYVFNRMRRRAMADRLPASGDADRAAEPPDVHPHRRVRSQAMQALYVLYDETCGFCCSCAGWLSRQSSFVPLTCFPAGAATTQRDFPLRAAEKKQELVVVDDGETCTATPTLSSWRCGPFATTASGPCGWRVARSSRWRGVSSSSPVPGDSG